MSQANLQKAIKVATEEFAAVLVDIISKANLTDLPKSDKAKAAPAKKPGRPAKKAEEKAEPKVQRISKATKRAGGTDASELSDKISKVVSEAGDGGAAISEIAKKLRLDVSDLGKAIALGLSNGSFVRRGERRGAKYYAK